jgi:DNA-directed RNA polymerase subunit alpha
MYRNWRNLIKPKFLEYEKESGTPTYGRFIARPLERGFGQTLGNALRRILLSSLQGVAITNVKIEASFTNSARLPGC